MQLSEYRVPIAAVIEGPGKNRTMKGENCPEKNAQDGIQGYTYIKAQQESWLETNQSLIEYPGGR